MKEKIKYLIVPGLMLLAFAGYIFFVAQPKDKAQGAQGSVFSTISQYLTHNSTVPSTATTTFNLVYQTVSTTTYTFNVSGVDQVNLNLFTIASSTTDNLYFAISYTNATTTYSDTWYREDVNTTSGAVTTHNTSQLYHIWNPAETTTSTKNILISNVNANYMKIDFWAGTTTIASKIGLWGQAVLSKPY